MTMKKVAMVVTVATLFGVVAVVYSQFGKANSGRRAAGASPFLPATRPALESQTLPRLCAGWAGLPLPLPVRPCFWDLGAAAFRRRSLCRRASVTGRGSAKRWSKGSGSIGGSAAAAVLLAAYARAG